MGGQLIETESTKLYDKGVADGEKRGKIISCIEMFLAGYISKDKAITRIGCSEDRFNELLRKYHNGSKIEIDDINKSLYTKS